MRRALLFWVKIPGCLLSLLLLFQPAQADGPKLPPAKGESCVEPTDVMRRDHMKFLLHQRDKTVHQGIRTKKHSLKGCIDCHVQSNSEGEFIPVDAPEQFCQSCHEFASVKLDCFECHATTPDEEHAAVSDLTDDGINAMAFSSKQSSGMSRHQLSVLQQLIEQSLQ